MKEIMDSLSPSSPIERTILMKGAQIAATESGNNWIGYVVHQAPGPMMVVQPTVEMAKRNSKQRIDPMVEDSPVLRKLVQNPRARDSGNTILSKEFPGGIMVMTGANSAVGLRSMAARYLFLDEVDGYPGDVEGEGDPVNLALARTRTFARRKVFMASTPKISGISRIESLYDSSDQRTYWVPCPICKEFQTLKFPQIEWPKGEPDKAWYNCEINKCRIENHHKTWMLAEGKWRAAKPSDGKTAGYHISSLYSPVGWFSWADAAAMFEEAQKNPSLLQVFVNTVLGETWALQGDAPEWKRLYDQREKYEQRTVPARGLFLTAGADMQKDRIEVQIVAWGRNKESWLVDHIVLDGNTSLPAVWGQLADVLNSTWRHPSGVDLNLMRMAIDSGYATQEVYAWARQQGPGRVLVIKGQEHGTSAIGQPSPVDVNYGGKKIKRGIKVWPVATSMLKSELYGWLKLDGPTKEDACQSFPPGYCHFPQMPEEFFRQLTAEQLVTKVIKGYRRQEWVKVRERNEALDCRVYARAAASQFGIDRFNDERWRAFESMLEVKAQPKPSVPPPPPVPPPPTRTRDGSWLGDRGKNWLRR